MSVKQELLILQLLAQSCGEHSGEGDCRVIRHKFMSVYEEACDWAVEQGFADYTDDGVQLKDDPFESVDLEQRAKTSPGFWGRACARLTTKNAALLERCEKMEKALIKAKMALGFACGEGTLQSSVERICYDANEQVCKALASKEKPSV